MDKIIISGPTTLTGTVKKAKVTLPIHGNTEIRSVYHLDRGYENLVGKFSKLGANISRVYA